jgi:type II secretory pathway pseudopilin PulG
MRFFSILAIFGVVCPVTAAAHFDPNWSQREMERMQAQQERWDAQAERQRAEQERQAAQAARQRVRQERQSSQYDAPNGQYQTVPRIPDRTPVTSKERLQPIRTGNDLYRACTQDIKADYTPANLQCLLFVGDIVFGEVVVKFAKSDGTRCFPQGVDLGSGLIDQSQKMTVAARATAEKKAFGHRS